MKRIISTAEIVIKWFIYGMLLITALVVAVALFSSDTEGEAPTGSFDAVGFNEGWMLEMNGKTEAITLPVTVDAKSGDYLIIKNTLPADISDGSSLMMRASMEDMYVYINGELRKQYATESTSTGTYYLPSAYVVTGLSEQDSCAEIAVHIRVKSRGTLNEVLIGQGNNVWFGIIQKNIPVNAVAFVVLILGVILIIAWLVLHRFEQNSRASFFLGLLMTDIGIWVFSESNLRQIIFSKPSLSSYFAYLSVELLGVLACFFFDEVQHKKYHNTYIIIESVVCIQLAVNLILSFTKIAELYQTLIFSHIWMALGLIFAVVNVIKDIRTKRIK